MAKGKNTGKKYIKLRGDEIATAEDQARANKFMVWYGRHADYIRERLIFAHLYDDEVATDTMVYLYECIAFKGLNIKNYKWYFLRAYHTNYLAALKRRAKETAGKVYLDDEDTYVEEPAAPNYDYEDYEARVEQLRGEILEYVRGSFDAFSVSLFEMYIELQPEMNAARLAKLLGIPEYKVGPTIKAIKADVVYRFADRRDFLLSLA